MPQKKDILSYFPKHLKPRDVQKEALTKVQEVWDRADIIVVKLPVAAGKSAVAMTVAKWAKKASIIAPNKLLVDQYSEEYPAIHVLRGKSSYWCSTAQVPLNRRPKPKNGSALCSKALECEGCDAYRNDTRKARVFPYLLSNYYTYMAHRLYRDVLIADEAHKLIDTLRDMAGKTYWTHQWEWPDWVGGHKGLKDFINDPRNPHKGSPDLNYKKLKEELFSKQPRFIFERTTDMYHREMRDCIKMIPVDISDEPPFLWPSQVKKIVLMSATISRKDIEQMGLGHKRVVYVEADSPIPAYRREVILPEERMNMSYKHQETNLPLLVKYLAKVADENPNGKGLVHMPYSLSRKVQNSRYSMPKSLSSRLLFHTNKDKLDVYRKFRETDEPRILVGSGMEEGVDLAGQDYTWQVIAKVPWPSLGEPAIQYLLKHDNELYTWETVKKIMQAVGRICRGPTDRGKTYVFDNSADRLFTQAHSLGFLPKYFLDSVIKEN